MANERPPLDVLDSITEGCQVIGAGWKYLYLNEAAARQGQQPRDALIGRSMVEAYPGIESTKMFALLRSCMEQRTHHHFENEFTFPDGSIGWFDLRFEPVPDGVFILSRDITDRKRAELERLRLATAIEASGEAVIIADEEGNIEYVNPAFERVTGYSRDEVLGQNPRFLKSGRHSESFYTEMWTTLKSGKAWRGRLINRNKNGALFSEDAAISPVFDDTGSIAHFVCVKRDVSRELELEEQFRQSQKMEAIGQLAGGVAHDFNNMLSLIIGYTDVLLQNVSESDPLRPDIVEIRRAGERASALTAQLLAFSRKQILRMQPLDLNALFRGTREMLGRLLGETVELTFEFGENLSMVTGDPGQLEQILMNLAVNARDAMPKGGRLTVQTRNVLLDEEYVGTHFATKPGPHVMMSVSDSGVGMDEQTRARIFEPFFTTKSDKGTGLGLSTVYGIVKQLGGTIWVYSEPGMGTTFKIYFPVAQSVERTTPARAVRPVVPATGETILLVEDEEAVRKMTRRLLVAAGYSVLVAADAKEALGIIGENSDRIDLMLTDLVMPKMGGVQLAEEARRLVPSLPVLFMSGYAENAVGHFEDLSEETQFIGKPFSAADLSRKVREVLDERR